MGTHSDPMTRSTSLAWVFICIFFYNYLLKYKFVHLPALGCDGMHTALQSCWCSSYENRVADGVCHKPAKLWCPPDAWQRAGRVEDLYVAGLTCKTQPIHFTTAGSLGTKGLFLFLFKRVQLHTKPSHGAGDKNNCFLWQIYQSHESWRNGSETESWEIPCLVGLARATSKGVVAATSGYWMKG